MRQVVLLCIAAAMAVAPAPAAEVVNAWPNPGAEVGTAGATADGPDAADLAVSQQGSDSWRGKRSFELRFTPRASGAPGAGAMAALVFGGGTEPVVRVAPGQVCFFRVAGRVAEGSAGTALELRARWLDDAGRVLLETPALCHCVPSGRRPWAVLDGWDTVPAGATRAALALYAVGAAAPTVLRADGVQITIGPPRNPAYVEGDEPGCAWLGPRQASASSRPPAAVNLVPNPNFEGGTEGWRRGYGPGAALRSLDHDQTWASGGRASLRLAGSVGSRRGSYISMVSQPIPVVGGQEYTLRAAVNVAKIPAGGKVALVLGWIDSNGAYLFAESMADQAFADAPGIRQLEVTKPAPRHAVAAVAAVGSAGAAAGDYEVSADSFSLIADSGAAPTRPFWVGFNDQLLNKGPLTREQDVAYDVQLGVNAVRLPINLTLSDLYKQVWPAADAPINLDAVAPTLDAFFAAGVRVLLLSPITPWMIKNGRIDPDRYADVGKLSAAFVRRWPRIIAVEAHNEPNTGHFWPPAADPALFVCFLEAVYRSVKEADPKMPVLAPSCNAALTKGKNLSIPAYMRAFYAAGGGRWCDALSIHPYPYGASSGSGSDRTRDFWTGADECMRQLRAVRDAAGDSSKPIWITELGSATTGPSYPPLLKTITEEQQARSTALLYDWARRQADVHAIIYHTNASRPKHPEGDYGLLVPDGRLKPAFLALQAELHRTPPPYFDGDTPGCRWLGPAGASPSIRPASDAVK